MNTPENKAKFFAQYWGQEVLINNEFTFCVGSIGFKLDFNTKVKTIAISSDETYLHLKPLSSITDDDFLKLHISGVEWESITKHDWPMESSVCDTLRLQGYAVEWNSITVEKQIEYGWIKLKEI